MDPTDSISLFSEMMAKVPPPPWRIRMDRSAYYKYALEWIEAELAKTEGEPDQNGSPHGNTKSQAPSP